MTEMKGITRRVEDAITGLNKSLHDLYAPAEGKLTALEHAMMMGMLVANATEISKYLNGALIDHEKIDFRQNFGIGEEEAKKRSKSEKPEERISVAMAVLVDCINRTNIGAQLIVKELYEKENPTA